MKLITKVIKAIKIEFFGLPDAEIIVVERKNKEKNNRPNDKIDNADEAGA